MSARPAEADLGPGRSARTVGTGPFRALALIVLIVGASCSSSRGGSYLNAGLNGGTILFTPSGEHFELDTIHAGGSGQRRLHLDGGPFNGFALSPDGTKVALASDGIGGALSLIDVR